MGERDRRNKCEGKSETISKQQNKYAKKKKEVLFKNAILLCVPDMLPVLVLRFTAQNWFEEQSKEANGLENTVVEHILHMYLKSVKQWCFHIKIMKSNVSVYQSNY